MRRAACAATWLAWLLPVAGGAFAAEFPPLLYTSESEHVIRRYDAGGRVVWECPAETARDVWQLPNGNVLFPYSVSNGANNAECGAMEVAPDKRIVWQFRTSGQVYSCQRLTDGNTVVGATQQGRVLVVSPEGRIVKAFAIKNAAAGHGSMRSVRGLANGNFLVAEENARAAREYDAEGRLLREFKTPFPTYSAVRLPSGNTMTSGKTGVAEFDPEGRVVWELKDTEVPQLGIRWFAGLQVLPNGNLFVCNAGGKVAFAEISRDKRVVWMSESATVKTSMGHGIQRLDVAGEPLK